MVFLREGGKDELSILLEHGRKSSSATTPTTGGTIDVKGKGRALPSAAEENTTSSIAPTRFPAALTTATSIEPSDSLLHRLAGPSTGKAGLKRE